MLRLAGGNFASFESAPLRIRALYLDDVFGGAALFGSLLASHFVQVGIVQSFKIIGARMPPRFACSTAVPVCLFSSTAGVLCLSH